jgi:hypothetical protein
MEIHHRRRANILRITGIMVDFRRLHVSSLPTSALQAKTQNTLNKSRHLGKTIFRHDVLQYRRDGTEISRGPENDDDPAVACASDRARSRNTTTV